MASTHDARVACSTTPSPFCGNSSHFNGVVHPLVKEEMAELHANDTVDFHTLQGIFGVEFEEATPTQETGLVVPKEESVIDLNAHEVCEFQQMEHLRQEKSSARNAVEATVIELDSDDDKAVARTVKVENIEESGSPDMSRALVVVPSAAEEMAVVRSENGEASSLADFDGVNSWRGFNTYVPSYAIERRSTGDGSLSPRVTAWDGPPRWSSSQIGILTVQCARCLKWRVVPRKEQYEAIRENILERPWVCENALQWRSDAHCNLPTDLDQDSSTLWAIDKPNLPSSPPGWQRKVIVRRDCSTRFADVYYTAPDGKTLRSMVEIGRYLEENPRSVPEGTSLRQFSFTIPQPLPGVWAAKKRPTMRSATLPSSEGNVKRAKAPQPLAKQLAQRLLHGTNPSMLPLVPAAPLPFVPASVQPLAVQSPSSPPAPHFSNPPAFPLPPLPLPTMRNSYPLSSSAPVGSHGQGQVPSQTDSFSPRVHLNSSTVQQSERNSNKSASMRRKREQQKSRLGVATSLTQNLKLPGILPLRDPSIM